MSENVIEILKKMPPVSKVHFKQSNTYLTTLEKKIRRYIITNVDRSIEILAFSTDTFKPGWQIDSFRYTAGSSEDFCQSYALGRASFRFQEIVLRPNGTTITDEHYSLLREIFILLGRYHIQCRSLKCLDIKPVQEMFDQMALDDFQGSLIVGREHQKTDFWEHVKTTGKLKSAHVVGLDHFDHVKQMEGILEKVKKWNLYMSNTKAMEILPSLERFMKNCHLMKQIIDVTLAPIDVPNSPETYFLPGCHKITVFDEPGQAEFFLILRHLSKGVPIARIWYRKEAEPMFITFQCGYFESWEEFEEYFRNLSKNYAIKQRVKGYSEAKKEIKKLYF